MAANPNDPRHNPDMDDAAGKLADAAGKLSEAAGKRGVTDPIRHNPDLDAAFGVAHPMTTALAVWRPPAQPAGLATTAQQVAAPGGGLALGGAAGGGSGGGPGPNTRSVQYIHIPSGGGGGGGSGGGGGGLGAAAGAASAVPGPVGAVGRGVTLLSGLFGGGGGGNSGGGLGGLVSGLSGPGASGVAETAQKVAGMVPVVGDVIQGLMKFTRAVIDGADAQHKLNMQYADYSAAMAGVLAEAEMRDWQRNREIGDKTADTARDLAESRANYQDNMGKVEALFSNVKNEVFSKLLDVLNTVLEPIATILDNINDTFFEQATSTAADKWLDDVVAKTKARQQAGDDWFRVRRGGD